MASGVRVPIVAIRLLGGKMHLTCMAAGPLPASSEACAVTVFGEDGAGVCQGYCGVTWREAGPLDTLTLRIALDMARCYGDAEAAS
jgi:hypothetical protein